MHSICVITPSYFYMCTIPVSTNMPVCLFIASEIGKVALWIKVPLPNHQLKKKDKEQRRWGREVEKGIWIMALACPPAAPCTCTSECENHAKRRNTPWERELSSNQCNRISADACTRAEQKLTKLVRKEIVTLEFTVSGTQKRCKSSSAILFFSPFFALWTKQHK